MHESTAAARLRAWMVAKEISSRRAPSTSSAMMRALASTSSAARLRASSTATCSFRNASKPCAKGCGGQVLSRTGWLRKGYFTLPGL